MDNTFFTADKIHVYGNKNIIILNLDIDNGEKPDYDAYELLKEICRLFIFPVQIKRVICKLYFYDYISDGYIFANTDYIKNCVNIIKNNLKLPFNIDIKFYVINNQICLESRIDHEQIHKIKNGRVIHIAVKNTEYFYIKYANTDNNILNIYM